MEKKRLLTAVFISMLLFSVIAGTPFVNLGKANPFVRIPAPVHPKITILSPEDNSLHASNSLTITFNVSIYFEKGWSSISYVTYKASWQQDEITFYERRTNSSVKDPQFLSEFSYKLNLTGIPEGKQTVTIIARGSGGHRDGEYYEDTLHLFSDAYNSASISFTIASVSILSPQNKTYDTYDVPLIFEHRSYRQILYSLDGQDKVMVSGNTTLTDIPIGEHNVPFYVMDKAGNIAASETIYFNLEVPFPTTLVLAPFASVAFVGIGLLVYFKKRKHQAEMVGSK